MIISQAGRSIESPCAEDLAAGGRQALLVLARLRYGHTYAQLAAGFRIGTSTVYRCITEAVGVLAVHAPGLPAALRTASSQAFVILDGTLLPIDWIAGASPSTPASTSAKG